MNARQEAIRRQREARQLRAGSSSSASPQRRLEQDVENHPPVRAPHHDPSSGSDKVAHTDERQAAACAQSETRQVKAHAQYSAPPHRQTEPIRQMLPNQSPLLGDSSECEIPFRANMHQEVPVCESADVDQHLQFASWKPPDEQPVMDPSCDQEQQLAPSRPHGDEVQRPRVVIEMERRAEERRRIREERLQRRREREDQEELPSENQTNVVSSEHRPEVKRPKLVREMERRAEERQRVREEREKQKKQARLAEEQTVEEARRAAEEEEKRRKNQEQQERKSAEEKKNAERLMLARRSKKVLEMERRAEERQRVWEERRQWHKQREEAKLAEEQAAEEARRAEEQDEKKRQIQQHRERKAAEQRKSAEKLMLVEQRRQRMRQAQELWVRNRLIDVWCALRQAVIESDEMMLAAWRCYRDSLQRSAFSAWRRVQLHDRSAREGCRIARARLAEWQFQRHCFRVIVNTLRLLKQRDETHVLIARRQLAQGCIRRGVAHWRGFTAKSVYDKRCRALKQFTTWLLRDAIQWWLAGVRQCRLDAELESHKQALHKKVSGWLQEIDVPKPVLNSRVISSY